MSGCDDVIDLQDGFESSIDQRRKYPPMKKIMSVMLGLSLVLGAASFVYAQAPTTKDTSKTKKAKGTRKGKTPTTKTDKMT